MAKIVARLFRDPESAQKAVGELLKQGFPKEEIGLLLRPGNGRRLISLAGEGSSKQLTLGKVGEVTAVGALGKSLAHAKEGAEKSLAQVLGATPETFDYYEFGLAAGGILVTVNVEEARQASALRILRAATGALPVAKKATNRGFEAAARMSATDPMDAKMTGDFRRY